MIVTYVISYEERNGLFKSYEKKTSHSLFLRQTHQIFDDAFHFVMKYTNVKSQQFFF